MMKNNCSRSNSDRNATYTAVNSAQEDTKEPNSSENSPLLENMEKLNISSSNKKKSDALATKSNDNSDKRLNQTDGGHTMQTQSTEFHSKANASIEKHLNDNKERSSATTDNNVETGPKNYQKEGARPKHSEPRRAIVDGAREKIDIVRKMSESQDLNYVPWQKIGPYSVLKQKQCQRLFAASGRADDLALFFHNGRFYIMEAWCSHMGGPLFEGDIEDYNGKCHVMCPWHSYMFDLETGRNEIGLQQKVYDLKYEGGLIYVRYHTEVSLTTTARKPSVPEGPRVINRPPEGKHEKMRKKSVLDSPISLAE